MADSEDTILAAIAEGHAARGLHVSYSMHRFQPCHSTSLDCILVLLHLRLQSVHSFLQLWVFAEVIVW